MHDKLLDSASFREIFLRQPLTLFQNFDTPHVQERERTPSRFGGRPVATPPQTGQNGLILSSPHITADFQNCAGQSLVQLSLPVTNALHVTFRMTVRRNKQYKVRLTQKIRLTMAFADDGGLSIRDRSTRSIEAPQQGDCATCGCSYLNLTAALEGQHKNAPADDTKTRQLTDTTGYEGIYSLADGLADLIGLMNALGQDTHLALSVPRRLQAFSSPEGLRRC